MTNFIANVLLFVAVAIICYTEALVLIMAVACYRILKGKSIPKVLDTVVGLSN